MPCGDGAVARASGGAADAGAIEGSPGGCGRPERSTAAAGCVAAGGGLPAVHDVAGQPGRAATGAGVSGVWLFAGVSGVCRGGVWLPVLLRRRISAAVLWRVWLPRLRVRAIWVWALWVWGIPVSGELPIFGRLLRVAVWRVSGRWVLPWRWARVRATVRVPAGCWPLRSVPVGSVATRQSRFSGCARLWFKRLGPRGVASGRSGRGKYAEAALGPTRVVTLNLAARAAEPGGGRGASR